jgi:hypothetical protein
MVGLARATPFRAKLMSAKLREEKKGLKASLLDLITDCPFDHCNPVDCPLYALRQLPRTQRIAWFDALPEEDLSFLASYHYACLSTKVESPLLGANVRITFN